MPSGIGVVEKRVSQTKSLSGKPSEKKESVIIDPMTKEVISIVAKVNGEGKSPLKTSNRKDYVINDHWFVLKCKFLWKGAPEKPALPLAPARRSSPAISSAKKK
jgi:hypothetical protein